MSRITAIWVPLNCNKLFNEITQNWGRESEKNEVRQTGGRGDEGDRDKEGVLWSN